MKLYRLIVLFRMKFKSRFRYYTSYLATDLASQMDIKPDVFIILKIKFHNLSIFY